jgi:hypothetical protein
MPPVAPKPEFEKGVFDFQFFAATGTALLFCRNDRWIAAGRRSAPPCAALLAHADASAHFSLLTIASCSRSATSRATAALTRRWALHSRQPGRGFPSSLPCSAGSVSPSRERHVVQRPLWKPPESHRRANGNLSDPHLRQQQLGRRHGEDDRRPKYRRRADRDRWVEGAPDAGTILRAVFWHSLALAILVGILVWLQARVWPG